MGLWRYQTQIRPSDGVEAVLKSPCELYAPPSPPERFASWKGDAEGLGVSEGRLFHCRTSLLVGATLLLPLEHGESSANSSYFGHVFCDEVDNIESFPIVCLPVEVMTSMVLLPKSADHCLPSSLSLDSR